MKLFLLLLASTLVGCSPDLYSCDQCKRKDAFETCMRMLPTGTPYSQVGDLSDAVDACDRSARNQSYRVTKTIPLECVAP